MEPLTRSRIYHRKDSLEIVVSAGVGSGDRYQVVIAPGVAGHHAQPRVRTSGHDRRDVKSPAALNLEPTIASRKIKDGYVLEALLPLPARGASATRTARSMSVFNDATDDAAATTQSLPSWFPADTKAGVDPAPRCTRCGSPEPRELADPKPTDQSLTEIEFPLPPTPRLSVMPLRNPTNAQDLPITVRNAGRLITRHQCRSPAGASGISNHAADAHDRTAL